MCVCEHMSEKWYVKYVGGRTNADRRDNTNTRSVARADGGPFMKRAHADLRHSEANKQACPALALCGVPPVLIHSSMARVPGA